MNKVIFLDIDGCLHLYAKDYKEDPLFDPNCVKAFNRILKETDTKVVISSSWRLNIGLDFVDFFTKAGVENFQNHFVGMTPDLSVKRGYDKIRQCELWSYVPRGLEIEKWIETHGFKGKFAIIDDSSIDFPVYNHSFFYIEHYRGITEEYADDIIQHLNK